MSYGRSAAAGGAGTRQRRGAGPHPAVVFARCTSCALPPTPSSTPPLIHVKHGNLTSRGMHSWPPTAHELPPSAADAHTVSDGRHRNAQMHASPQCLCCCCCCSRPRCSATESQRHRGMAGRSCQARPWVSYLEACAVETQQLQRLSELVPGGAAGAPVELLLRVREAPVRRC